MTFQKTRAVSEPREFSFSRTYGLQYEGSFPVLPGCGAKGGV